jgi:ankyrin repeat protein
MADLGSKLPDFSRLEHKIDPNRPETLLSAMILHGASGGNIAELRDALLRGGDPNSADLQGITAVGVAAAQGQTESLELLVKAGANVNKKCPLGFTPLRLAVVNGHTAAARLLIDHGANVNDSGDDGNTALTVAAFQQRTEIVQMLVDKGANVNLAVGGMSPLMIASVFKNAAIVQILKKAGAA